MIECPLGLKMVRLGFAPSSCRAKRDAMFSATAAFLVCQTEEGWRPLPRKGTLEASWHELGTPLSFRRAER
jgi:hypothetical protein